MAENEVEKSIPEINEKIEAGEAVVVTAEEMVDIVEEELKESRDWRGGVLEVLADRYFQEE